MRVVAGEARGRRLQAPPGEGTRPTLDRVREALFNALHSLDAVDGAVVLDAFAGSGALGIEALSRGAARCTFLERSGPARRVVVANLAATGLTERAEVLGGDAWRWLEQADGPFDLVLLDPPYATADEAWARLLAGAARLAPRGVVVVESDRPVAVPGGWDVLRQKGYGDTLLTIARPTNAPTNAASDAPAATPDPTTPAPEPS